MRIPLSWIKEYIDLELTPEQIGKMLTMAGLEVDGIEIVKPSFDGVVVGQVVQVEKHPDANQLQVASVTDGKENYTVVCGAPNCRQGMRVAFARIGAVLQEADGKIFKIKKSKIRGVESFGMLCSGKELGLSDDHEGILDLPSDLPLGLDFAERYSDVVFEISLTPNLNHCASVLGVVRELAAATGLSVKVPEVFVKEDALSLIKKSIAVSVESPEACPRYACRLIRGVKIAPSPAWMQDRLHACGIRPVNNAVDITNYVLLEMGHPLHAFDFNCIEGSQVHVRFAKDGEKIETLDGKTRLLTKEDLLICDKSKGLALAGVMGGVNSEVGEATVDILLESAYFHPKWIRKTSKRLGLQTDASKRFERGADPNGILPSLSRAAMLFEEITGGKVCSGVIDVKHLEFSSKTIACRMNRINQILGTHLSISEVEEVFKRLHFEYNWDGHAAFHVKIPTYRVDILAEIDLIEEVARIYGYDNITKMAGKYQSCPLQHAPIFMFEREIRSRLSACGLQEFLTCDLIGPSMLDVVKEEALPPRSLISVLNPTSIEQSILRSSLLPGLLQVVKYNVDHQNYTVNGFEVGRIHFKDGDQYKEQSVAGIILSGQQNPSHWDEKAKEIDFFDMKGIIENLLEQLGVKNAVYKNLKMPAFHPGRQASVFVDSIEVGSFGEVHPSILRRLDVRQRILFGEFNLHDLFQVKLNTVQKMQEVPIYPGSDRDWTVTLQDTLPIEEVFSIAKALSSRLLQDLQLLDIYRSDKLGSDYKNATFRFVYRDCRKTAEQADVDAEHQRLTSLIISKLGNSIKTY